MASIERHFYPGNNTPEGFFSYYQYILGQQEANRIFCIKGGPGTGKSTFMKKVAASFLEKGEDVDFMHCSSDNNSIDGIVLKNRKVAMIDGTAPHVVDPVHPGAVDTIIHLGEFWDEEGIRRNKGELMASNQRIKRWFERGYRYLAAAGSMYGNLSEAYEEILESAEIYKLAAKIVGDELSHKEICLKPGNLKKFFASAITPGGIVHNLNSLASVCRKVYLISAPVGVSNERLLSIIAESAIYRGFDVEEFYCPIRPSNKVEHLVLPEAGLAFLTVNSFHDLEPWEISAETVLIDMSDLIDERKLEMEQNLMDHSMEKMNEMLASAVDCIRQAKEEHDILEMRYYVPNMDFKKIDALRDEMIAKILKNVL